MVYAEIILPLAGPVFYTYSVPAELEQSLMPGSAVSVGLGVRKLITGIVWRLHRDPPSYKKIKPVLALLFPRPLVSTAQMRLWEWIAEYYMCSLGEVMRAALPALLKPSGLSAEEFAADEFRARTVRTVGLSAEISSEKALAQVCEKLRRRAPKQYEALVEIGERAGSRIFDGGEVVRADLAADGATLTALHKKGIITIREREESEVSDAVGDLPRGINNQTNTFPLPELSTAQQKALEEIRMFHAGKDTPPRPVLLFGVPSSGKSEVCFHAIADTLSRGRDVLLMLPEISLTTQFVQRVRRIFGRRVVLYHSGLSDRRRAEAYLRLAYSKSGSLIVGVRSAVLLPMPRLGLVVVDEEQDASYKQQDPAPRYNARDTAIVLAGLSGDNVRVILASATPSLETWSNAIGGKYGLVELSERWGGTLPPKVIISDTVRSVKRGERRSHFNKELLDRIGETLEQGRQVILFQNRRGIAPLVECSDCGFVPHCAHCDIPMTAHRSGLRCHYCGTSAPMPSVCPACSGRSGDGGYGGGSESAPPKATSPYRSDAAAGGFISRGFGTEKIEEELVRLFPSARIARLDRDSAGSEAAYSRIISDFEQGATDILVGTRMVTKGLDFARVALVGILNADNLLSHLDFRASERAYALIMQVAGRAGRRDKRGEVVIQTAAPESRLIAQVIAGDWLSPPFPRPGHSNEPDGSRFGAGFRAMAAETLAERALYGYPPYTRLVSVMLRNTDREILHAAATGFGEILRKVCAVPSPTSSFVSSSTSPPVSSFAPSRSRVPSSRSTNTSIGIEILGPVPPVVERIKNEFALLFLLKIPRSHSMSTAREKLQSAIKTLLSEAAFRGTTVTPDVDPQ